MCTPLRSALSAVAMIACGSLSTPVARAAPSFSAASARMPLPQPKSSTLRPCSSPWVASVSSQRRHRAVVGWVPEPKARPGSRRMIAASAAVASSGSSWFHGTIQVRVPKRIGWNRSIHARSQSWSSTAAKRTFDQSRPGSKDSIADSNTSPSVSAGNSAVIVISSHNGISPTPGSKIACSSTASRCASCRLTASAPTSSSARS